MASLQLECTIDAPVADVFRTVAHIDEFAKCQPQIVGYEFVSERRAGVGTRFVETRRMGEHEASTELEVTEYVADERVRLVADTPGAVWDTVFATSAHGDGTRLTLTMEARATGPDPIDPALMDMLREPLQADLDRIRAWCEQGASA